MYLSREEERMLEGEYGWAYEVSMKILVKLGELFKADRLIPIESAHISGVSYKTIGDAPIEFLEKISEADGRVRVPSTLNPSGLDMKHLASRLPRQYRIKQTHILNLYRRMGIKPTLTCTPYYLHKPEPSAHLAWAESSAVVYANSILGAYSNREGGPSALAAALVGKTPNYGIHKAENRKPKVLVKIDKRLHEDVEFGALGIYLGKTLKDEIPLISGLPKTGDDNLKQLGAGLASSGMLSMFLLEDPNLETSGLEKISVGAEEIGETIEGLSSTLEKPDLVFIGCPHCSTNEIREIARLIEGKKVRKDMEFWVCISEHLMRMNRKEVEIIEGCGGKVLCDTCAVVTWVKELGIDTIMTNSAKTAYYAPTLCGVDATLASLRECVKTACGETLTSQ